MPCALLTLVQPSLVKPSHSSISSLFVRPSKWTFHLGYIPWPFSDCSSPPVVQHIAIGIRQQPQFAHAPRIQTVASFHVLASFGSTVEEEYRTNHPASVSVRRVSSGTSPSPLLSISSFRCLTMVDPLRHLRLVSRRMVLV